MSDSDMAAYYLRGDEAERLFTWGRLERERTELLLERHMPRPPAVVRDVGGGPGAYAVTLGARGYEVALLDPIELHVEQARAAGVADVRLGDARELPWDDASSDAVLLLGPLYHLQERPDRIRALAEARRVLRPGGVLCAAVISRFAPVLDGLFRDLFDDPRFEELVRRDLESGRHLNPERVPAWFTTAYFHRPEEIEGEVRDAGLEPRALVGIEGPGGWLSDLDARLDDPARRATLLTMIERLEAEPTLLGASAHLLSVSSRPR